MIRLIVNFTIRRLRKLRTIGTVWRTSLLHADVRWAGGHSIGAGCHFSVVGGSRFLAGRGVALADGVRVFLRDGELSIGEQTFIGYGTIIASQNSITIGRDVLIAEYVTIRDQDHVFGGAAKTAQGGFTTEPVTIGDNVWVGAKVTVTKGVTIGQGSVIGANSVVTKDIPANCVAAGVPARVLRSCSYGILSDLTDKLL